MNEEKTLVLVDGSSLAFRSFYALFTSGMRAADGMPTWAIYGFFRALFDLIEKRKPDMIAVCFDLKAPTFRHGEYEEYKANRLEMPDDLSVQWPVIKQGVEVFKIPLYELEGYEADDVIGTVATDAAAKGIKVLILTGDQDAFQLLDDRIQVLMPGRDGGVITYGRQEVFDKLGVWPEQVVDYKALCGDTSDNIPGVKGVGPKTAVSLLTEYKTLESLYEHLDQVKGSTKQKLSDGQKSAYFSKSLATIRLDIPLDFDFEHCRLTMPDVSEVADFLQKLKFTTILRRLPQTLAPFNNGVPPVIDQGLLKPVGAVASAGRGAGSPAGVLALEEAAQADTTIAVAQMTILPAKVSALGAPEPVVVRAAEQLEDILRDIAQQSILSVDLETTSLNSLDTEVVGYALAWSEGARFFQDGRIEFSEDNWRVKTAYIPVRHWAEQQLDPEYVAHALKPILENPSVGKIAQNGKFEMNVLSLVGIKVSPLVFDPMLASYIVNSENNHGLKDQSERILGHTMVRISELIGTGKKQATMDTVPVSKVAPYAADDARVALELARHYYDRLDAKQRFLAFEMDQPLVSVLAKMEQNGVALDLPYLSKFSIELGSELARLEREIFELAGHSFNINSTQQLQKLLFEELGLPAKTRTKFGYSTDASVLESLRDRHPVIGKILDYRQLSKLRSTYVDSLPKQISLRDGRLHGEFNQTGTTTGRLSSSNPNLQNIPIRTDVGRRIRRAFVPGDSGSVLISADYSQIELRLLAHMSGDETLIDAFSKDQDVHARTAQEIFDIPIAEVTSDMRRIGKTINFSLIYQQGAYSTGLDLGISTKEAQSFIDKYFSRYPKVRGFMQKTIEDARTTGYVETLWGRRRYFSRLNDRNEQIRRADERAACNAPLQGSAADLIKLAMIQLDKALTERGLASKLILQVHDELVLEVPENELEETTRLVISAMNMGQPLAVPLRVDVGVGKNWMDM